MRPEGRVAWVTGAAGGIGRATVARLARAGYHVEASDLLPAPETRLAGVRWSRLDVTDEAAVNAAAADLRDRLGRLDAVVHLAGRTGRGPLVSMSLAEWNEGLEVNLTTAFLVARAAFPLLKVARGTLVLVSSTNGLNGGSALSGPAYAAAKAAVLNLTRYLAREWAPDGVRTNCVAPGPVDTPMLARLGRATADRLAAATPLGRLATADDVAATIEHLCSEAAAFLTGTVHNVSGGLELD
jgi:NAD(P)-dependent dehydrogenase (short-subunit alcohol dehydrogenase family)